MSKPFLALALVCLAAMAAPQAAKTDNFDFLAADIRVLQDRKVQDELKVTKAQRDKMNGFAKQHTDRLQALEKSLGASPTETQQRAAQAKVMDYTKTLKEQVMGSLNAAQVKRLREVSLQAYGWPAVADDRVAARIGMNAAQIAKVRSVLSAGQRDVAALQEAAVKPVAAKYEGKKPKDEAQAKAWQAEIDKELQAATNKIKPKFDAIRNRTVKGVQDALTPAQRAKFVALQGKPFKT